MELKTSAKELLMKIVAILRYPSVPPQDRKAFLIWYRSQFRFRRNLLNVRSLRELKEKNR